MLSHVRNGEAGRLRDVHALNNEELVSYGLAHHIVIADKRNELSRELAGRTIAECPPGCGDLSRLWKRR